MPFRFTGSLALAKETESGSLIERVCEALRSQGGQNISFSNGVIRFDGIINSRSFNHLANILHGELALEDTFPKRIDYSIMLERTSFIYSTILFLPSAIATFVGFEKSRYIMIFGAAIFIFSCIFSFVIRWRFCRWLRVTLDTL